MTIYLTGFMASGKSVVGRETARLLDRPFVDLDGEVERRERRSIRAIFDASGETAFRDAEQRALLELSLASRPVVATGGGVVLRPANIIRMDGSGHRVWLKCPLPEIVRRLEAGGGGIGRRPLWTGDRQSLGRLLEQREPLYARGAGLIVDAAAPVAVTAAAIVRWLEGPAG